MKLTPKQITILEILKMKQPLSSIWIAYFNDKKPGWCGVALSKLVKNGLVHRSYPEFKYTLTDEGKAALAPPEKQDEDIISLNW